MKLLAPTSTPSPKPSKSNRLVGNAVSESNQKTEQPDQWRRHHVAKTPPQETEQEYAGRCIFFLKKY